MNLYLDNWCLAHLHKENHPSRQTFFNLIQQKPIRIVFSLFHIYETLRYGQPDRESRIRFLELIDTTCGTWLRPVEYIKRQEVARYFYQKMGIARDYTFNVFCQNTSHAVIEETGLENLNPKGHGIREAIDIFETDTRAKHAIERLNRLEGRWPELRSLPKTEPPTPVPREFAINQLIADLIPRKTPAGLDIPGDMKCRFLEDLIRNKQEFSKFLGKCPTLDVRLQLIEQIRKNTDDENCYLMDIFHTASVVYCDLVVLDGPMHDYLRRCKLPNHLFRKCHHDLEEALKCALDS